jgi:hypothetical protein
VTPSRAAIARQRAAPLDTCEHASLTGKFFRGLPPAVVDDIGATLGLAAARTVPRYVGPGGGEVRIIISAYRAPRSAMMSISVHRPLPRWGRRRTRALHWTRNSLASLPGRHEWHPLLARPWQLLGSYRVWTGGPCRTSGSRRACGAGRTDCSHVPFVPFFALLTGRTLRPLWPLNASLTLSSRNPLHTLGALRTGRALRACIALRPRILTARCQRKRNADDE